MKKRIVSLLLALCLLAGLLPAVTPQADAVISTVIGTSLKMCTSLVKGGIYACRNGSEYDNAGQGVLAVFKYAGSDLLGIDFGGSSSGQTKETRHPEGRPEPRSRRSSAASASSSKRTALPSISWNGPSRTASPVSRSRWRI